LRNAIDALKEIVYIDITKFLGFQEMSNLDHVTSSSLGESKVEAVLRNTEASFWFRQTMIPEPSAVTPTGDGGTSPSPAVDRGGAFSAPVPTPATRRSLGDRRATLESVPQDRPPLERGGAGFVLESTLDPTSIGIGVNVAEPSKKTSWTEGVETPSADETPSVHSAISAPDASNVFVRPDLERPVDLARPESSPITVAAGTMAAPGSSPPPASPASWLGKGFSRLSGGKSKDKGSSLTSVTAAAAPSVTLQDVYAYTQRHLLRIYPAAWKVDSR
jgi:hypothetical protein